MIEKYYIARKTNDEIIFIGSDFEITTSREKSVAYDSYEEARGAILGLGLSSSWGVYLEIPPETKPEIRILNEVGLRSISKRARENLKTCPTCYFANNKEWKKCLGCGAAI